MPNYENYKCPVCHKQFDKNDDIVTCPECGTPHHRECYKIAGHCVNEGLHKSDYSFLETEKPTKQGPQASDEDYYIPQEDGEEVNIVSEAKKEADKQDSDNPPELPKDFSPFQSIQFNAGVFKEKGEIDGVSIADIAATVRSNATRFVMKFKDFSNKKVKASWNWSAFFFGSFYLLFRKMYKQGIAFFCLVLTTIISGEAAILKLAPKYIEAVQGFVNSYEPSKISVEDVQKVMAAPDSANAIKITYIVLGVILVLRIIQAIFADYFYKGTVFNIIKRVEEQLDNGANFTQTAMLFGQAESLDQEQMKKIYLGNKGGVSFFAPFTAYFIIYIILTFI